ncbi:hypothetical protein, partial [Sporomusa sp.]|uniref:hypothetical protein n=1 Tax=Sporomusa sp. TaxID=2078658 RepID=UPI002BD8DD0A
MKRGDELMGEDEYSVNNDLKYLNETQWQVDPGFFDKTMTFFKDWQNSIGVDAFSSVRAEYMLSPDNPAYGIEDLTEQEKAEGITLQYNEDGTSTKVKDEIPLPGEIEKINDRDRVTRQSISDGIGYLVESWKSWQVNQEKESLEAMAKGIIDLEGVTPEDPLYEFKLQEVMAMLKEVQDSVVSGGMKFVRGLNGVIKESSKADNTRTINTDLLALANGLPKQTKVVNLSSAGTENASDGSIFDKVSDKWREFETWREREKYLHAVEMTKLS